jgi:hypothetical protein
MKVRYICKECGWANSIDSVRKWFCTPHFGAKKLLKCRHCNAKRHYMKRYDGRKWLDWPKEKEMTKGD